MLDAANKALQFAEGREREEFAEDDQLAFALIKCIEIVGEAASRISE